MNLITDFKENLHYVPTKMFYKEIDLETPGVYSMNTEGIDTGSSLEALCEAIIDMENLIKKNLKLSQEKLMKFTDNNPIQMTLREALEETYREKN